MALDPTAERKFQTLKRRLDALHYQQPLSKQSNSKSICPKLVALLKTILIFYSSFSNWKRGTCWKATKWPIENNRRLLAAKEDEWRA